MEVVKSEFFSLIKCALQTVKYQNTIQNSELLYKIAAEAGLSGLIFISLDPEKMDLDIYKKFERTFYGFNQLDVNTSLDIQEISNIFSEHEIEHVFLKGSFLKQIYPESYMRSMGDIDVLVNPEKIKKAADALLNTGYRHYLSNYSHECFFSNRKTLIEVHGYLDSEKTDRFISFLNKTWDEVNNKNLCRYELNLEFNLVYLLIHLVKHLNSSGIGIRSVLDIGIFMNHFKDQINYDKLTSFLQECELELFYRNMLWLNQRYFGFDFTKVIGDFTQDDRFYQEITDFIILSGVHGFGEDFNRFTTRITHHVRKNQDIRRGKFKHLIVTIFPSKSSMEPNYRYVVKYPILLPWAWLSRWMKLLFKQTNRTFRKIKNMFIGKKQIERTVNLFDKLGV